MASNSLKSKELDKIHRKIDEISQKIGVKMPYTYYLKLAAVYFSLGEFKKALEMLNLAEKYAPSVPEIWLNKAEIFKSLGKHMDAIEYYKKYFKIYPKDTLTMHEMLDVLATLARINFEKRVEPFKYPAPIRILQVDDEPAELEITKVFLKRRGNFEITGVLSVRDALEKLTKEHFDVIVSDYSAPGINGLEFLEIVRRNRIPIPFILFSGKGGVDVGMEALNRGADRYIAKPGDPHLKELAGVIQELMKEKASSADKNSQNSLPLSQST